MLRKALSVLILSYLGLGLVVTASYNRLPERVAIHFDADGAADGWEAKPVYAGYLMSGAALIAAMCAVPTYLARHLPVSLLNVPRREYWLTPERRAETNDRLFALGLWIASATTWLFATIHVLTIRANDETPPRLSPMEGFIVVAAFAAVIGIVIYGFSARAWKIVDDAS